jgi:hypothetical protein
MNGKRTEQMSLIHVLEERMNRLAVVLLLLLLVAATLIAPAAAAGTEDNTALESIDEKLSALEADPVVNAFLYQRMCEYNASDGDGITAVKIAVITGGPWYGSGTLKTFYIIRDDAERRIVIRESYEGDDGSLWTFYPRLGQTRYALDALLSREVTTGKLVHLMTMETTMGKENVPGARELIRNSPWMCAYLSGWNVDLPEQGEVTEEWNVEGRREQLMRYQRVELFILGQQARRIVPLDRSLGMVQRELLSLNGKLLDAIYR